MARFTVCLLGFVMAAGQLAQAAPLGNLKCNVARLKTVANLKAATKAVDNMAASVQGDQTATDAVDAAQAGLSDAGSAIQDIATALLSKQDPPADARDAAANGLVSAKQALASIQTTDPQVTSQLDNAKQKVQKTIDAGQQVLDNCGGAGGTIEANNGTANANGDNINSGNVNGNNTNVDNANGNDVNGANANGSNVNGDNVNGDNINGDNTGAANAAPQGGSGTVARTANIRNKRQIGNLQCNVARLQTVTSLAQSMRAVNKVSTAGAADATTTGAADTAKQGLTSARSAIGTIAAALLTGQQAPAAARDQVGQGLNDAKTALASINSTDPAVTAAVADAQSKVDKTLTAGGKVVANCK